jgi:REP element-mobilizing transposase RayT
MNSNRSQIRTDGKERRKSLRLSQFDYSEPRSYFFTICSFSNRIIFNNPKIVTIINDCWINIPSVYPSVKLDEFIVMPNHIHGILCFYDIDYANKKRPLLGTIIGSFKSAVTKTLHEQSLIRGKVWQRNYFERIIRNDEELNSIRKYILENPLKWELDRENPNNRDCRGQACLTPTKSIHSFFEKEIKRE